MIHINAIFLSRTTTQKIYDMTLNCIHSFINAEKSTDIKIQCILIESNKNIKNEGYIYPDNIKVIIPEIAFNFHKFLNIGLSESTADYYALCNNDIIFENHFFTEILKVAENTDIKSFSPFDYSSSIIPFKKLNTKNNYYLGHDILGWCIILKHELLETIGFLDETFDFYYADDDYGLTLRYFNEPYAVVVTSKAKHLGGVVTKSAANTVKDFMNKASKDKSATKNLPWYLHLKKYHWIVEDKKMLNGHMKLYKKWGDFEVLRAKKFIHNKIMARGGSKYLSRLLFSHNTRALNNEK